MDGQGECNKDSDCPQDLKCFKAGRFISPPTGYTFEGANSTLASLNRTFRFCYDPSPKGKIFFCGIKKQQQKRKNKIYSYVDNSNQHLQELYYSLQKKINMKRRRMKSERVVTTQRRK